MANVPTNPGVTVIDQLFYMPDGVTDFVYADADEFAENDLYDEWGEYASGEIGSTRYVPVPENLTILDQTMRRLANGQMVVDVVLQTDDIEGVDNFQLRVTKTPVPAN